MPTTEIDNRIARWTSKGWRGTFGAEINADYIARTIRDYRISTGQHPTKDQLRARMPRVARPASAGRMARKTPVA